MTKLPAGSMTECKRCPRLIVRRQGRRFCAQCSKVRRPNGRGRGRPLGRKNGTQIDPGPDQFPAKPVAP